MMRSIPTFYAAWPSDTPGHIVFAAFDRRILNGEKPLADQLQNALFYDELPGTFALQIGSHLISQVAQVAQTQAQAQREAYYARIVADHALNDTDPEQLGRLNSIISGMGAHDLDPTYRKPEV